MFNHNYPAPDTYSQVLGYAGSNRTRRYNRLVENALTKHKSVSVLAKKYFRELAFFSRQYPAIGSVESIPGIQELVKIHERLDDSLIKFTEKRRNVAFIGEFSSGKSTLINAILGREILPMDLLEGTTTYPIELTYGPYGGDLVYEDSSSLPVDPEIDEESDIVLAQYELARLLSLRRGLSHFRVSIPNRKLVKLTFFDTPGINSNFPAHTERAIRATKLLCDIFVVIIPSTQPLTDHLLSFLKQNLSDKYEQCIFVLSKFDLIRREDERKRLCENITTRLIAGLGLNFTPELLPTSADLALSEKLKMSPNEDRAVHLTEAEIQRELRSFRMFTNRVFDLVFRRSILNFEEDVQRANQDMVKLLMDICECPYNVLGYASSTSDFGSFDQCVQKIQSFHASSTQIIDRCLRDTIEKLDVDVDYHFSTAEQIVCTAIDKMSKKDELETWSAGPLHTIYRRFIEDINRSGDFLARQLRHAVGKLLEGSLENLHEEYEIPNCELLLTIPLFALDVTQTSRDAEFNTNTAAAALGNGIGLGGAATGAGVGALILGPVGFLAGGILGGVIGHKLNLLTETDRSMYKTAAMESLRAIRSKAKNQARSRVPNWREYAIVAVNRISSEILDEQKRKISDELKARPDCSTLLRKARSDLDASSL